MIGRCEGFGTRTRSLRFRNSDEAKACGPRFSATYRWTRQEAIDRIMLSPARPTQQPNRKQPPAQQVPRMPVKPLRCLLPVQAASGVFDEAFEVAKPDA